MSTGTGLNVSKTVAYAVMGKPAGTNVSKATVYAVFGSPAGVNVSKAQAYAVIAAFNSNPPSWPSTMTLPDGTLGAAYSQVWDLSPAAFPTTYTLASGSLPTGLSLASPHDDVGSLSGTPTALGSFTFSITATNSYGAATRSFTVIINTTSSGGPNPILLGAIPGYCLSGQLFNTTLTISGGTSPYSVVVASGSLPPGISLSGLTLNGTSTTIGTYNFALTVTDTNGLTSTQSFQITVGMAGYGWVS
jgi:large repetitive protein